MYFASYDTMKISRLNFELQGGFFGGGSLDAAPPPHRELVKLIAQIKCVSVCACLLHNARSNDASVNIITIKQTVYWALAAFDKSSHKHTILHNTSTVSQKSEQQVAVKLRSRPKRSFWGSRFVGRDTPDFGHAFSNRS